jgi:hypothetical protein
MQSERIEQRALNKDEKRSYLRSVQHELPVHSTFLVSHLEDGTRIGAGVRVHVS